MNANGSEGSVPGSATRKPYYEQQEVGVRPDRNGSSALEATTHWCCKANKAPRPVSIATTVSCSGSALKSAEILINTNFAVTKKRSDLVQAPGIALMAKALRNKIINFASKGTGRKKDMLSNSCYYATGALHLKTKAGLLQGLVLSK